MRALETRAVHPPAPPAQEGRPLAPLLDSSTTYSFTDTETFARASQAKRGAGYVYSRWANPTVDAFESALSDLEGTESAEAFASGMAAISSILLALCSAGDRIVAARQLYGNTYSLFRERLPRYGITATLCDHDDHAGIEAALDGAKMLYCETIGNPRIQVSDLDRLGVMANDAGIPLVVDNTFASPALCRPVEHGASVVVHSATKFIGGHHDLLGGVVCADERYLGPIAVLARDLGPTLAPFNAWLGLRGIATLPLRVERSSATALAVARALGESDGVEAVYYPGLETDPSYPLTVKLLGGRGGGTLAFVVRGGRQRAGAFQEALDLILPAASLGGTHSLIVHAAGVTHTQLSPDELASAGISEGLCRLSVGLEDPGDLIADLTGALAATE